MQARADVVRGVGVATTLIAGDQHTARNDAGDTGKPDPLPDSPHGDSLPKLRE